MRLRISIIILFCTVLTGTISYAEFNSKSFEIAQVLLKYQGSDGMILMHPATVKWNKVIPYFSNLAASGLVQLSNYPVGSGYLQVVEDWLKWYSDHMNNDGTIYDYTVLNKEAHSTGNFDSTDSYAASFLDAVNAYSKVSKDTSFVKILFPSIVKAVDAIQLTYEKDGLTFAKPNFPAKYLMDNVEVYHGLKSASEIASRMNKPELAKTWQAMSDNTLQAIDNNYWNDSTGHYAWVVFDNGNKEFRLEKWYPDLMAQLMAIAMLPSDTRRKTLFENLKANHGKIPKTAMTPDDIEVLIWWGLAAQGVGDKNTLSQIRTTLSKVDYSSIPLKSPGNYGQILLILNKD